MAPCHKKKEKNRIITSKLSKKIAKAIYVMDICNVYVAGIRESSCICGDSFNRKRLQITGIDLKNVYNDFNIEFNMVE